MIRMIRMVKVPRDSPRCFTMRCWLPLVRCPKEKRRRWQSAAAQLAERSGDLREAKEAVKSKAYRMQVQGEPRGMGGCTDR